MQSTKIGKNPAQGLAVMVVMNMTSKNMARASARLHHAYMNANPDATQDDFQAWAACPEENGYCRVINEMRKQELAIMKAEAPRIMEELGKTRGGTGCQKIWLPEVYPSKNPLPGMRKEYEFPSEGTPKPYPLQVKSRNVMQEHPEICDDNTGDSYHIVNTGPGLAPSGKLYPAAKAAPTVRLKLVTDEKQIYAKLGGTTYLTPVTVGNAPKKGKWKEWHRASLSVGHHIRTTADVMKVVKCITGKYDGTKSDLFCKGGDLWLAFRDGTHVKFEQSGALITRCNMSIEWCDPIPHDSEVGQSNIPQLEGKVPIVVMVNNLNFDNIFGFDMVEEMGSPSQGEPGEVYSRIVFKFGGGDVPVRTPKVLWRRGETPLWEADLDDIDTAGPYADEPSTTHHRLDGAVFHGLAGEQDMAKHFKVADLNLAVARELGVPFETTGSKIKEYLVTRAENGEAQYTYYRDRDRGTGGLKDKPNGIKNIREMVNSPNVYEVLDFLREMDHHDRVMKFMENLTTEVEEGLSHESWRDALEDIEASDYGYEISDLLQSYYDEVIGDEVLPHGPSKDIFAKYFLGE